MKKSEASLEGHRERKLEESIFVGSFGADTPGDSNCAISHTHSDNAWIKEVVFIPI